MPTQPHPHPDALPAAAVTLQAAAARLLSAGAPMPDVLALIEAVRAHVAEHAVAQLRAAAIPTTSPIRKGANAAIGYVRAAPFPLISTPPICELPHETIEEEDECERCRLAAARERHGNPFAYRPDQEQQ